MTKEGAPVTSLNARDRSLEHNYAPHDVAQDFIRRRLVGTGYDVEQCGIDKRHADVVEYSGKPDLKVFRGEELLAYIEVKSKRADNDGWFGRLNRRHFENYLHGSEDFIGAANLSVPVLLYFAVVDEDRQLIIRDGFIPVESEDQIETGFTSKGNAVVCLDEDDVRNFQWFRWKTQP
jgi:hypothetical protein